MLLLSVELMVWGNPPTWPRYGKGGSRRRGGGEERGGGRVRWDDELGGGEGEVEVER